MRRVLNITLVLFLFCATICAMENANAIGRQCKSVSLRSSDPLVSGTVEMAGEKQPGLTFWCEKTVSISTEWRKAEAAALLFSGDAALVWGQPCSSGELPAAFDGAGCAVSSTLAQALFGSSDVVGLTLSWSETVYTVRGVWESEEFLALLPVQDAGFTAVEIPASEETGQDPEGWVDTVLTQSGLPEPDWILFTGGLAFFVRTLAFLPLIFAVIVLAAAMGRQLTRYSFPARDAAIFTVLLAATLALPTLLAIWPQWLTPSRWSDFAWWGQTARQVGEQCEMWLVAPGIGRDLIVRKGILAQTGLAVIQCALCEMLRCRFRTNALALEDR